MSKSLTVVAFVLLVLAGAMGLRNGVAANATTVSSLSAHVTLGNGPFPPIGKLPGGGGGGK